ncbi:transducin beta-like protein 2 isoform X8 [Cimex lectularius]|uniref:WD repeat-containing protein 55 homolog n=1 Tax=Cimex lectularius TaxID=79782 RepID=A0A8I6SGG6_CIMLE|nr:transducin beta-like protein 2 isoform X8 [Cimex lectularius]
MDEAARILNKTLVPLLSNYLPFFITVLLGWIIVTKYYSDDKNQKHRTIFIWTTKSWKDKTHQNVRYNVEYDHASVIRWSPDSKAFVYNRATDNQLDVCKIQKKPDGKVLSVTKSTSFPKAHKDDVIGLGISVSGKFMMTCSSATEIAVWDLKGNELHRFDSYLINNYTGKVSPCGNFIAVSGFAPDVKLWEVCFQKTGEFKQVNPVLQLKGHESGVFDFSFNADSTQVATISKHGCWRLFNIKVEYNQGEEPKLIKSGKIKCDDSTKASIALSPDGQVIAVGSKDSLTLVNVMTGAVDKVIQNIYSGGIQKVAFDAAGEYVLTCGERHVHIFHNVTGRRAAIAASKEKLSKSGLSTLTKERLEGIIKTSREFLESMNEPC